MSNRYYVESGSYTGHCCFEFSIMDCKKDDDSHRLPVCECFNSEDAERICEALNQRVER